MKTKLENSLEAAVSMIVTNVNDTNGKFTDGELIALESLNAAINCSFRIAEAREDLEKCIKDLESSKMFDTNVLRSSGKEPWNEKQN